MYVEPVTVLAPKRGLAHLEVVFDRGPGEESWSVASFEWFGRPRVGIRWNGDPGPGIGTPQARGIPTWFVLPTELEEAVLTAARSLASGNDPRLLSGYQQMARDKKREREADEWSEGLLREQTRE